MASIQGEVYACEFLPCAVFLCQNSTEEAKSLAMRCHFIFFEKGIFKLMVNWWLGAQVVWNPIGSPYEMVNPIGIPNHQLSWPKALQLVALFGVLQCFGMKVASNLGNLCVTGETWER